MSAPIVRQLILKDLYLLRWMMIGSIGAGAAAIAIMPLSPISGYVGAVSLVCTLIILNIFLVMNGVAQEKKDKVILFILSLPVSTTQDPVAKVAANAIAFLVPWLVLTIATFAVVDISATPERPPPLLACRTGIHLFYYCALLAVGLVWGFRRRAHDGDHRRQHFVQLLHSIPAQAASVAAHAKGDTAVWTGDIIAILGAELVAGGLALGSAVYLRSRAGTSFRGARMSTTDRLHGLDAVRAFALLLGVIFHAGFSFIPGMIPGIWAMNDRSPSVAISVLLFTAHIFRMSLFFFIAGFFARMMFERKGARGFWSNRAKRILVPLVAGWVVLFRR